ncbi:dipeptidase PepE [Kordia sp. YSTF-M3]|uniref:Dipeptidase PepE n=1 Tax=Kordia aestuariivivens TaxID=2759037 RepID=A0ABR7Q4L4_9FLAO|nr:dipeptidase PepE [Kordia aestuariivivens]MBC8753492.1 dipeptidase PepE [Kordia aestuariivivens]
MKNIIIASTSTVHGSGYLVYLLDELTSFYKDTEEILFLPYARPGGITHDEYTAAAAKAFEKIGKTVRGIHEFKNPVEAIANAKGIFTGGGNTFLLVSQLYKHKVMQPLREAILDGTPYLGTSAGSNICGLTMQTTNDMPIIYPPSFKTLGVVPFNINPHYLDPIEGSKHMGETRETRIKEFHKFNTLPVVGIREGSWIRVIGDKNTLEGPLTARIFEYEKTPYELETGSEVVFL